MKGSGGGPDLGPDVLLRRGGRRGGDGGLALDSELCRTLSGPRLISLSISV